MGEEPNPQKMPLESSSFSEEVQVAFFMLSLLPDRYDSSSGVYLGKDWGLLEYIFNLYDILDPAQTLFIMKMFEIVQITDSVDKERARVDKQKQKTQSGGRNYTHNVSG